MADETMPELNEAALTELLHGYFGVPRELMRSEATFESLDLDSLALMELVVVLEERTGGALIDRLGDLSPASTLAQALHVLRAAATPA
ncbi:acyl carrier protein [Streptomyces sp. NPDC101776]|uniref:acyl carrier protein n=1 Tax=Streptomyces sp. NPDC101776 TaxID=3366146 RepID=UPI0037FCF478